MSQQTVQQQQQASPQQVVFVQDDQGRTTIQLVQDAENRAAQTELKPATEQLPSSNITTSDQKTKEEEKKEEEAKQKELEEAQEDAEETLAYIRCATFILLFGFGILSILGVGSIIFYLLDWAASLFDFDLSEYTQWIILLLTFINIIMSCCGCYGTYKFSEMDERNRAKLAKIQEDLENIVDKIAKDNEELAETLRKFEVEITHFEGENKELIRSLRKFEAQSDNALNIRSQEATLFVTLRELWNLYKIFETNDIIAKITKCTAEFYIKAYQDNDIEPGLNEQQYIHLIESAVISRNDKPYFPPFNDPVWDKNNNESILVDEFERVLVMIYKKILNDELKIELSKDGKNEILQYKQSVDLSQTQGILQNQTEQQQQGKRGIFHL